MNTSVRNIQLSYIFLLCAILVLLSSIAYLYNVYITQYPGNNYCNIPMMFPAIEIALAYIWYEYNYDSQQLPIQFIKESTIYIMTALLIGAASNAVQFTPFSPIDTWLVKIERFFHMDLEKLVYWTKNHPMLRTVLDVIYHSITLELYLVPITVLLLKQYAYVREFCFMLLATCILGYFFYYFFPTTAPASIFNQQLFDDEQILTGLKFWQIHHYISPSGRGGGMIAMPSYHIIWAWLCTNIVRFKPTAFYCLAFYNTIMVISCVLLGWHYSIDVLSSILTILLARWILVRL